MYVVYINLLYFLSIFLFTYNKNLLSQKKRLRMMRTEYHSEHNVHTYRDLTVEP